MKYINDVVGGGGMTQKQTSPLLSVCKMKRRRLHRLILFFKALNGLIDWDFNFYTFKDIHNIFIIILVEEMTFVSPSHVAPGARTDLSIKLLKNGTCYPTKQKALLIF